MKVPSFKTEKIRDDIFELVEIAPTRAMYEVVLKSIDHAMDDLSAVREEIPSTKANKISLKAYDDHFAKFGEREAYYYQAFLEAEDRSIVDAPLFAGDYDNFGFSGPGWPDIETPWRMANELSGAAVLAGEGQDFLEDLERRFKNVITEFWDEANRQITLQKEQVEQDGGEGEVGQSNEGGGRRYGFWPLIAVGAAALVGALGTASVYAKTKGKSSEGYVDMTWWGKNKAAAKNIGLGVVVGLGVAALLILRRR
jgi:hypothetical protein